MDLGFGRNGCGACEAVKTNVGASTEGVGRQRRCRKQKEKVDTETVAFGCGACRSLFPSFFFRVYGHIPAVFANAPCCSSPSNTTTALLCAVFTPTSHPCLFLHPCLAASRFCQQTPRRVCRTRAKHQRHLGGYPRLSHRIHSSGVMSRTAMSPGTGHGSVRSCMPLWMAALSWPRCAWCGQDRERQGTAETARQEGRRVAQQKPTQHTRLQEFPGRLGATVEALAFPSFTHNCTRAECLCLCCSVGKGDESRRSRVCTVRESDKGRTMRDFLRQGHDFDISRPLCSGKRQALVAGDQPWNGDDAAWLLFRSFCQLSPGSRSYAHPCTAVPSRRMYGSLRTQSAAQQMA